MGGTFEEQRKAILLYQDLDTRILIINTLITIFCIYLKIMNNMSFVRVIMIGLLLFMLNILYSTYISVDIAYKTNTY